jgi:hypothetical protein
MLQPNNPKKFALIVAERPFPEFAQWWTMGSDFMQFMSAAIVSEWERLDLTITRVRSLLSEYVKSVYNQVAAPALVDAFMEQTPSYTFHSGEFDSISFAFYRSVFESLEEKYGQEEKALAAERRRFTQRVGKKFFTSIHNHLQLRLPADLSTCSEFDQLKCNIDQIERFLLEQRYLRDICQFTFSVDEIYAGKRIKQGIDDFLDDLHNKGVGYALYIMGYPAILPSAVYLYQMFGEAQHHSSRMIEELFDRVGYKASEADDFDPSRYPSDKVVELWSIRSKMKD